MSRITKRANDYMNLFSIQGRNCLVTGANGQIGLEIVKSLITNGAGVVAIDLEIDNLESEKALNNWSDQELAIYQCDISNENYVSKVFSDLDTRGVDIDSIVNNAGASIFTPFMQRTEEELDLVLGVNIKGTFWFIKEFCKFKKNRNLHKGTIVNIASHYGVVSPDPRIYTDCERRNSEIYGASKAGIIQMTKYFAVHLADSKIRVNAIAPGGIVNPTDPQGKDFQSNYSFRCPMKRMGELREIIGSVIFLLSDASSYVNGHTLVVDGGVTAW